MAQSQELFQERNVVSFTIQMWTQEIRAKIMELLRPDHPEIKEKDVRVMPYESVRLVVKPGSIHKSVKIMEEATPYRRLNEKLNFFLLCDLPATANALAENLRSFPEFVVIKWQLELECRGLALNPSVMTDDKTPTMNRYSSKFIVSILPTVDHTRDVSSTKETTVQPPLVTDYDKQIKDLQTQIHILSDKSKNSIDGLQTQIQALNETKTAAALPVFSVRECTNPSGSKNDSLSFASFEIETKKEYGNFDLKTGIFTVKKSGIFQFNFTGLIVKVTGTANTHQFELRVDGSRKSLCFANLTASEGSQHVVISAILKLNIGQKVSMVRTFGGLYDGPGLGTCLFSCVFFS